MMHKVLNNTYAKSPCAYCRKHCVSLTAKQVKGKECLKKNCWHLVKYEHNWWHQREIKKQRKKEKRMLQNAV